MHTNRVVCDSCGKEVIFDTDNPFKYVGITVHIGYKDEDVNDYDLCMDCFTKRIGSLKNGRRRMKLSNWLDEDGDKLMLKPREEYLVEKRKERKEKKAEGVGLGFGFPRSSI